MGRKYHNRYTLGDIVKVQVARADLDHKQLDFALVTDEGNPNKPLKEVKSKNPRHNPKDKGKKRTRGGNKRRKQ